MGGAEDMELREDFLAEEMIGDTLVSREMKKVWAVNLDLLAVFQRFCEQHGLRWFMGFGTLLGAVRHQGFVPWDDDVDILMPRADFEALKLLYAEVAEPYFLQNSLSDPEFWQGGMMKFRNSNTACIRQEDFRAGFHQGIGLEIMALDACPERGAEQRQQAWRVSWYQRMLRQPGLRCGWLRRRLLRVCRQYEGQGVKRWAIYTSGSRQEQYLTFAAEAFQEAVPLPFENLQLPAPKGFWDCLEQFYGRDFLCQVPQEYRQPHHLALWSVDESYRVWQHRFLAALQAAAGKTIVLFGTGNMLRDYEQKTGGRLRPAFYVDNDPTKWGRERQGIPIRPPEELLQVPPEKLHLIICNNYYREISRQLQQMGIQEFFVYTDNFPVLFTTPEGMENFGQRRRKPYRVGYVQGTFDLFHIGHLNLLRRAKARCDYLIAGVVSDELNRQYKGQLPCIPYEDRAAIVRSVRFVDQVICVDLAHEDKLGLWERYHYDCHFSGDDHTGWEALTAELRKRGSNVEFFPYTQRTSSSQIKQSLEDKGRYGIAAGYPCDRLAGRLALYGAGKLGRALYQRLMEQTDKKVLLWVDKCCAGECYGDMEIQEPAALAAADFHQLVIAVKQRKVAEEIRAELLKQGIPAEKIFWTIF